VLKRTLRREGVGGGNPGGRISLESLAQATKERSDC
jgi:hypothetical protein